MCQRGGSRATLLVCSKPQTLAVGLQHISPIARRKTIDTVGDGRSICGCTRAAYPVAGLGLNSAAAPLLPLQSRLRRLSRAPAAMSTGVLGILAKRPSMSVRMHAEILIGPRKDDQVARWPRDVPRRACTTDSAETTSLVGCASGHKRRKCPSPILRYRAEAVALGSPACADDHERCRTSGVAD